MNHKKNQLQDFTWLQLRSTLIDSQQITVKLYISPAILNTKVFKNISCLPQTSLRNTCNKVAQNPTTLALKAAILSNLHKRAAQNHRLYLLGLCFGFVFRHDCANQVSIVHEIHAVAGCTDLFVDLVASAYARMIKRAQVATVTPWIRRRMQLKLWCQHSRL